MGVTDMTNREINALVAEHVLNLPLDKGKEDKDVPCIIIGVNPYTIRSIPQYSTDISEAWKVVEKLYEEDLIIELENGDFSDGGEGWYCHVPEPNINQFAETAPMAICLAALKAKGIDTRSNNLDRGAKG